MPCGDYSYEIAGSSRDDQFAIVLCFFSHILSRNTNYCQSEFQILWTILKSEYSIVLHRKKSLHCSREPNTPHMLKSLKKATDMQRPGRPNTHPLSTCLYLSKVAACSQHATFISRKCELDCSEMQTASSDCRMVQTIQYMESP